MTDFNYLHPPQFLDALPSLQQVRGNRGQQREQGEKQYINPDEQLELEMLKLKNDTAGLFWEPPLPQPPVEVPRPAGPREGPRDISNQELEQFKQEIQQQINSLKVARNQVDEVELGRRINNIQLYLHIEDLEQIDADYQPYNFSVRCKYYGMGSQKFESPIQMHTAHPYFDMNVSSPLTLDIVKKMEYNHWVVELWNNDLEMGSQSLVGIVKLDLSSIRDTLLGNTKIEKASLYPAIIYDNPEPVLNLRTKEVVGHLRIKLAYGTYVQITRFQKLFQQQAVVETQRTHQDAPPEPNHEVVPIPHQQEEIPQFVDEAVQQPSEVERSQAQIDEPSQSGEEIPELESQSDQPPLLEEDPFDGRVLENFYQPSYGKAEQPPDMTRHYRNRIRINMSSLINYGLPAQQYQISVAIHKLGYQDESPAIWVTDRITNFDFRSQFTFSTRIIANQGTQRMLFEHALADSQVQILVFGEDRRLAGKGFVPSEEITDIPQGQREIKFVSIYEREEVARLQIDLSYEIEEALNEIQQEQAPQAPHQVQEPLSMSTIIQRLQPERLYTINLGFKQMFWLKSLKQKSDQFRIHVAGDRHGLDFVLPQLESDMFQTKILQEMQHINLDLKYEIRCDQLTINQVARTNMLITFEYFYKNQVTIDYKPKSIQSFTGKLPLLSIFEEQGLQGDIPLFKGQTPELACTLQIDASLQQEQDLQSQMKQILQLFSESAVKQVNSRNKYFLKVIEVVLVVFDEETELGDLYLTLVDPIQQSENYRIGASRCLKIDTSDCVFQLNEEPCRSTLELRSIINWEPTLLCQIEIETHQLIEDIKAEANYYISESRNVAIRVGAKVISLNYDETNLNQTSLVRVHQVFESAHLNQLKRVVEGNQSPAAAVKQYLRQKMNLSFSEINFLFNLFNSENIDEETYRLFSDHVIRDDLLMQDFRRLLQGQPATLIRELQREFSFFDYDFSGFVEPKNVKTILGFFNLDPDDETIRKVLALFIPSKNKDFDDVHVLRTKKQNHFDYVSFLNVLQVTNPRAFEPLFEVNDLGPMNHQIQHVLDHYSPQKQAEPPIPAEPQEQSVVRNLSNVLEEAQESEIQPLPPLPQPKQHPAYQSSDGSSQPQPKEKTSSSGTKVANVEKKLPEHYNNPENIKRLEEIMRRNHLNYDVFNNIASDDDDEYD